MPTRYQPTQEQYNEYQARFKSGGEGAAQAYQKSVMEAAAPQAPDPNNPLVALRGQVIKPQDSQRVTTAAGQADAAAGRVAQGSTALPQIPAGSPLVSSFQGPSAGVQNLTNMVTQQATDIGTNLPNRSELAAREFDLLSERSAPAFDRSLRDAMALNAAGGRMGSGLVTRDLADITSERSQDLAQAQESLALRTSGQELADRLGILSSLSGVQGQLSGQDLAQAAARLQTETAQSSEQRGLRDEQRDEALRRMGVDMDALGALTGREQVLRGNERGERDEMRGERARADTMAETANQRRIQQMEMEARIQSQLFNQLMARAGMGAELGYGGTNVLDAAGGFSTEAGRQGTEQLDTGREAMRNFFLQQMMGEAQPVSGTAPGTIPTLGQGGPVLPTGTDLGIPEYIPDFLS